MHFPDEPQVFASVGGEQSPTGMIDALLSRQPAMASVTRRRESLFMADS